MTKKSRETKKGFEFLKINRNLLTLHTYNTHMEVNNLQTF